MISRLKRDEINRQLDRLSAADQRRVMDFIHALSSTEQRGTPGSVLTQFAGSLSEQSVDEMMAAIKEGCERIDKKSKRLLDAANGPSAVSW